MSTITISVQDVTIRAKLFDTPTAHAIEELLPLTGTANVWGDEIYFMIPLDMDTEADAREDVEVGELGYWPAGPAFCIFFGPTPVSTGEMPRAYSPVNVFGRAIDDARALKNVSTGAAITVELAQE